MNRIKSLFILVSAMALSFSCGKEQPAAVEYLEVNANNISGSWELVEWNGAALQEGTYVFVDFVRKDRTYRLWQNVDSFGNIPHTVSGSFFLENDPEMGAIIRGNYDHDSGDWAHRYIIRELTADTMLWVASDDSDYVQKYVRVESVPFE